MTYDKDGDAYQETVKRMEPGICFIDTAAGWTSCSVSLKRIADTMVWFKGLVIYCAVLCGVFFVIRVVVEYAVLR